MFNLLLSIDKYIFSDHCFGVHSEGIGDVSVLGDRRWAGGFGIHADFIAMENSHLAFIDTGDILVSRKQSQGLSRIRVCCRH